MDRSAASHPGDNAATSMKSVVADLSSYDWQGDQPAQASVSHHSDLRKCILAGFYAPT